MKKSQMKKIADEKIRMHFASICQPSPACVPIERLADVFVCAALSRALGLCLATRVLQMHLIHLPRVLHLFHELLALLHVTCCQIPHPLLVFVSLPSSLVHDYITKSWPTFVAHSQDKQLLYRPLVLRVRAG